MEIYVHPEAPGELRLVVVDGGLSVDEFIRTEEDGEGLSAWLEGAQAPLPSAAILTDAGLTERAHVHIGRCKSVAVSARYGGDTKEKAFPPADTVQAVFEWVVGPHGFNLSPTEKAKHTVAVCGVDAEADRTAHIGSLATDCALCLDLVPKVRFEG